MILCLTPNPAIDHTLLLPGLTLGNVHRAQRNIVAAGGKGLNVAHTIHILVVSRCAWDLPAGIMAACWQIWYREKRNVLPEAVDSLARRILMTFESRSRFSRGNFGARSNPRSY